MIPESHQNGNGRRAMRLIPESFLEKLAAFERETGVRIVNSATFQQSNARDSELFENIPDELKSLRQWVLWKKVPKPSGDGFTKVPMDAKTGRAASTTDPATWCAYHVAVAAYERGVGDGIGFVFTEADPFCGMDLDHVRNSEDGHLEPRAAEIVVRCESYSEVTPSGRGLHILVKGRLPGTGGVNSKQHFEMYDHARFFTMTGEHIGGTPTTIEERQDIVSALYAEFFPEKVRQNGHPNETSHLSFSDVERTAILAELKDALPFIPAEDREIWLHVGMAIHAVVTEEAGFTLWCDWSKSSTKYDPADSAKVWRSFHTRDDGKTHRTIFDLAIKHGWRAQKQDAKEPGTEGGKETPDFYRCTDLGNGERFIARYGHDLLYCNPWKKYLTWDGTRWELDNAQKVRQWARLTIRTMYDEAQRITAQAKEAEEYEERDKLVKRATSLLQHAVRSEAEARTNAMIHNAQMDCPVMPEQLDADQWLLNVANGTLDLRTGLLQPHRRGDLLTKLIPISYDSDASCPQWEAFLDSVMDGNQELVDFLWKAIGYSLTGNAKEDCLFLLYGTGANGKSTFQGIIRSLTGDYGRQAEFSTLLHRERDTVRNDLADLRGARLVTAGETEQDKRLSESVIKQLTGRDRVKARFLFQEYFEFMPQMKLWLAANYKPVIKGTDYGIWRRIRLVPFIKTYEGDTKDGDLPEKLLTELPGILAWSVRGCLAWQQEGLPMPEAVQVATETYRKEMDVLGNFLEECCDRKPHLRIKASALYTAYVEWSGDKNIKQTSFGLALNERGFTGEKSSGVVWRLGIALSTD